MKIARILEEESDAFCLEYDNTLGKTNKMRLDASTYETALREAKAFLGINVNNQDGDGAVWDLE
jgi:hypothetical protein